ncbi:MAG: sporulation protein YabP [Clostridia bacterium]|nr:sporulation protein YabP [Clostridia bacterium]
MNTEVGKNNHQNKHHVSLHSRESMEIHGVTDVISFDEESVVLNTVCGNMAVEGSSLHIHVLSMEEGIVTLDGRIDSLTYFERESNDKGSKNGFFGKLFR